MISYKFVDHSHDEHSILPPSIDNQPNSPSHQSQKHSSFTNPHGVRFDPPFFISDLGTNPPHAHPSGRSLPPRAHAQSKTLLDLLKSKYSPRLAAASGRQSKLSFANISGGCGGGGGSSRANGGEGGCDDNSDDDDGSETEEFDDSQ